MPRPSLGCTIWAATGTKVNGKGGTVVAKNRDNSMGLVTEFRAVCREKGLAFAALFDPERDGYVVAGINEKGLTVVNASAASLPDEKRLVAKEDLTERLLTSFATVDALVAEGTLFATSHPAFYLVADSTKAALIEVAPGGKTSIKVTANGVLTHANHYTDESLKKANERPTRKSRDRLKRINRLLANGSASFDLDGFISLSEDRSAGRIGAIRQECGPARKVCTLATWVVSLPKVGPPELYINILKSDYTAEKKKLTLDSGFWMRIPRPPGP
jgi:hypothetical protein